MARPEFRDGQAEVVSNASAHCWLHPRRGEQKNRKDRNQAEEISKLVNVKKIRLEQFAEPEQISERQNQQDVWRASIRHRYPDLHRKTYFVPPVQFNRVRYSKLQVGNDVIQVPQPDDQLSDVRADESRRRIHNAMMSMFEGKGEVMFICYAVAFDSYLNYGGKTNKKVRQKQKRSSHNRGHENGVVWTERPSRTPSDCGSATQNGDHNSSILPGAINTQNQVNQVTSSQDVPTSPTPSSDLSIFPRPRDLSPSYRRGEFDVLVIHRDFGLMVAEIKAVGDVFQVVRNGTTLGEQQHVICKGVGKLLRQLDKSVEVLKYLLTDIVWERVDKGVDDIPITKAVMFPNLSRQSLAAALRQEPALEQAFCQCLGDGSLDVALQRCVFSEQLPPIGHSLDAEHDVIEELYSDWWKPLMHKTSCSPMDASLYESIVARFCGPATKQYVFTATNPRAEVTTLSQAVGETARCFTSQQILTEQQVAMLKEASPRVMVSGPPGTGKAVMLMLKMKEWLRQGHHVLLVSLWMASHALSCHIFNKVQQEMTTEQTCKLRLVLNRKPHFHDVIKQLQKFRPQKSAKPDDQPPANSNPSLDSGFSDFVEVDDCWEEFAGSADFEAEDTSVSVSGGGGMESQSGDSDSGTEDSVHVQDTVMEASGFVWRDRPCHPLFGTQSTECLRTSQTSTDVRSRVHVVVAEAPWFLDSLVLLLDHFLGKEGYVIWVATSLPHPPRPRFTCFEVTRNLRRPPAVVREMTSSPAYQMFLRARYSSEDAGVLSSMPFPTDGPPVRRIQHSCGSRRGAWDCEHCGKAVATLLIQELGIGLSSGSRTEFPPSRHTSVPTLTFADVLVSGHLPSLRDVITPSQEAEPNRMGCETQSRQNPSPGFLTGLRRRGVNYDVMNKDDVRSYQTLASSPHTDRVLVAEPDMVKGLERPVVVVLATTDFPEAVPCYVDPVYDVMGCCTSQLVIVGDAKWSLQKRLEGLSM